MAKNIIEKKLGIPGDYQYKALRSKNFLQATWHKNKLSAIKRLGSINKDTRILDLGTGSGNLELALHSHCKEIIGVDYHDEALSFIKEQLQKNKISNVSLIEKDIRELDELKGLGQFDLITIIDVIEHIHIDEADKLIQKLHNFLKPEGKLLIITPNYRSIWLFLEKILDLMTIVPKFEGGQHLAKFYPENLNHMLTKNAYIKDTLATFNLISFFIPLEKISKLLLSIELSFPLPVGPLLAAVYRQNKPYDNTQS